MTAPGLSPAEQATVDRFDAADPAPESWRPAGAELIAAERQRQVDAEGWTLEHDAAHGDGDLALAAECYLVYGYKATPPLMWPWEYEAWKPLPSDRIRQLVKAGALIAAEIDRLQTLDGVR